MPQVCHSSCVYERVGGHPGFLVLNNQLCRQLVLNLSHSEKHFYHTMRQCDQYLFPDEWYCFKSGEEDVMCYDGLYFSEGAQKMETFYDFCHKTSEPLLALISIFHFKKAKPPDPPD